MNNLALKGFEIVESPLVTTEQQRLLLLQYQLGLTEDEARLALPVLSEASACKARLLVASTVS